MAWLKLGGLVFWKSDNLEWWPGWFPFCPTIAWILLNSSIRSLFRLSSNICIICSMEGGFGGGGGGGTYGSGDCPACRAKRRTGEPSRTLILQPTRVFLIWFFPSQRNRDEKHSTKTGEKPATKTKRNRKDEENTVNKNKVQQNYT